jgi:integrase
MSRSFGLLCHGPGYSPGAVPWSPSRPAACCRLTPATARDFRHDAAVHQVRSRVPLGEVAQQLSHARVDTTTIYTRLANPERRMMADRVQW